MRYLILLLICTGSLRAGIINGLLLTPFSWTDNEINKYINNNPVPVGPVKNIPCLIVCRKRVITAAAKNKIVQKDSKRRTAKQLEADFNFKTVKEDITHVVKIQ